MTDWTKKKYDEYYNSYVPWLEDKYLAWFGENKTSYATKGIHLLNPPFRAHLHQNIVLICTFPLPPSNT